MASGQQARRGETAQPFNILWEGLKAALALARAAEAGRVRRSGTGRQQRRDDPCRCRGNQVVRGAICAEKRSRDQRGP